MKKRLRFEKENGWNSRHRPIWWRGLSFGTGRSARSYRTSSRLHRWLTWAKLLSAQHTRLGERHHPAELVVVHPFSLLQVLRERLVVSTSRFLPQIHLAIHPILRRLVRHEQSQATFNLLQNEWHSSATVNAVQRSAPVGSNNMTLFNFMSPANAFFATAARSHKVLSGTAYAEPGRVPGINPAPQIPIDLVFQRLFRSEEQTRRRIESSTTSQSVAILLQRLGEQGQRVEAPGSAPATLTSRCAPQFSNSKITSSNAASSSATTHASDQSTWQEVSRPAPPINIDFLTDQVMRQLDRRIIAARERMGKI